MSDINDMIEAMREAGESARREHVNEYPMDWEGHDKAQLNAEALAALRWLADPKNCTDEMYNAVCKADWRAPFAAVTNALNARIKELEERE